MKISLESLNLAELSSVALNDRKKLPNLAAIYFCLDSTLTPMYIGQTQSLLKRWFFQTHPKLNHCKDLGVTMIAWIEIPDSMQGRDGKQNRLNTERKLIRHYRPPLNTDLFNGNGGKDWQRQEDALSKSCQSIRYAKSNKS